MLPTAFDAFLFCCKTAISAVLALLFYESFHLPGSAWAAPVSAVLISQPSLQPSVQASLTRFWANLIGASLGAISVSLIHSPLLALLIGVFVTGFACQGKSPLVDSLERLLAVMVGCSIALAVGLVFDKILFPRLKGLRKHLHAARPSQE